MELQSCSHLHFIQTIKGGSVTKVLNVARGRPRLAFKEVADIYDCILFDKADAKAERSWTDAWGCNANDGDDQKIINLDDDGFDNFTLKEMKESCQTSKRKHSQGFDLTEKRKIKVEDMSSLEEDYRTNQMAADDSDFIETLSSWRSKLSKNVKARKRKCTKVSTCCSQEIVLVVNSQEIHHGQQLPPSSGDSASLVDVKFEVPEADCFDGTDYNSVAESKDEAEITHTWYLENELHYDWEEHVDLIPLRMMSPSCLDLVINNSELSSDQTTNFPAIEFEDHNSDVDDNQLDGGNEPPASPPNVVTHKGLDCIDPECRDDNTFLGSCNKYEFTAGAEIQAQPSSNIEHCLNPKGSPVSCSDNSPEYEKKQSFASVHDDKKRHVYEATDELTSFDDLKSSPKLHRPEKLLSTRKAISPSSQEKLHKAMETVDTHHENNLKSMGSSLYFTEQTIKNGATEGFNDIMGAGFTDNPNKTSSGSKTFKGVSHPKGASRIPHSSRPRTRLGCSSGQRYSKSAIIFSEQQMRDTESIAEKLTIELKSIKDILDVVLRSEFCRNKSLRYKVNEIRVAVKNATRAEAEAKRRLKFMARDYKRFCKIMKLAVADPSPSPPQDGVREEKKKVVFADEAGGCLCQVRVYEDGEPSL
ncbi:uncharacterized protein LOC130737544 isoform X2 [Lotus japonicus]|uniref:uncharacterized protein LOC130737544 isoform X2 n=1 Tax=Lotus japonicus TaxID=34305 RepID=UPI002586897D|nr:uncharacterized protein LOC130737544 isoform X2 [Lotus japonicus]